MVLLQEECATVHAELQQMVQCNVLFSFLVKASKFVPILSQQYLQLTLSDVASVVQLILDYYREMPGPQIYARAMQLNTLKPEPG